MPVYRINEFPEGSGNLTNDDVFLFMDDPSGSGITKKISLSEISNAIGGGGGNPSVVQLGSVSGTINTDASVGSIFDLTLSASGLLANPTNGADGQSLRWRISYANSGTPLTLGNNFRIPSSASSPLPFSSSSGTMDMLGATYDSSRNKWDIIAFVPGY
jgi:hypothetical protein